MQSIDFGDYFLDFKPDFIKMTLSHEAHFDAKKFADSYDLKLGIYGNEKIGVLIQREEISAKYSFDPLILLTNKHFLETHVKWVAVVSNQLVDSQHLGFVKQMTNLPCMVHETCEEAKKWVDENFRV